MTSELVDLRQALLERPLELRRFLVAAMASVASRVTVDPRVVRAMAAAETITRGLVVNDEAQAAELADAMRTVLDGQRVIGDYLKALLAIPADMTASTRQAVSRELLVLSTAKVNGNEARVAWQTTLRRRAAADEEKRREQARQAVQQAAESGEFVPEAEVAVAEVPRTVVAGSAKSGTMVRVKAVEVVDVDLVPKAWLTLVPAIAVAAFNSDVMTKAVKKPDPGQSVTYKGVRFEAVETAVNRR